MADEQIASVTAAGPLTPADGERLAALRAQAVKSTTDMAELAALQAREAGKPDETPGVTGPVIPLTPTEEARRVALTAKGEKMSPAESAELGALQGRPAESPTDTMKRWVRDEMAHLQDGMSRHMRERMNP